MENKNIALFKIGILLSITLSSFACSCSPKPSEEPIDIRQYYYPIHELLKTKKVYEYTVKINGKDASKIFHQLWCEIVDGDTILNKKIYDENFELLELWQIKISDLGAYLYKLTSYSNSDEGLQETKSEIIENDILEWFHTDKQYTYHYKKENRTLINKNISIQESESVFYNNKKYPVCVFTDEIEQRDSITYNYQFAKDKILIRNLNRETYYVKGIGMYSIKNNSSGQISYLLINIMDYKKWRKNIPDTSK